MFIANGVRKSKCVYSENRKWQVFGRRVNDVKSRRNDASVSWTIFKTKIV